MKFLHTGDWHLGRSLHGLDLHSAQCGFVHDIERITRAHGIDCVIIAGDIFDRAVPPVESVALFTDALVRLSALATVVVIAGNHDSATRLGYGSPLHRAGVHIVTELDAVGTAIEVSAGDETVLVYPIPYLDPDHARTVFSDDPNVPLARSHEAVMAAALSRIETDRQTRGLNLPAVVVAHAFVVGGDQSDSERDIRVGGVDSVPAGLFAGFTYVALGHLHGPQQIRWGTGDCVIRYAGSPLRYSFSEAGHVKSVTVVTIDGAGSCVADLIEVKQPRAMAALTGTFDEVMSRANREAHGDSWVKVLATDPARPADLQERVRAAYPHALSIVHQSAQLAAELAPGPGYAPTADPIAVSAAFVADVTNAEPTAAERFVLQSAAERARNEVDA